MNIELTGLPQFYPKTSFQRDEYPVAGIKDEFSSSQKKPEQVSEMVVMDKEEMKEFFFMLAGIPYQPSEESSDKGGRWA